MKDYLIRWLSILLFIAISILIIRLFIWLIPIILILIIAYYIYSFIKEKTTKEKDITIEKNKKTKHTKNNKTKKIVIIDAESVEKEER